MDIGVSLQELFAQLLLEEDIGIFHAMLGREFGVNAFHRLRMLVLAHQRDNWLFQLMESCRAPVAATRVAAYALPCLSR